jgi:hypothetical protein
MAKSAKYSHKHHRIAHIPGDGLIDVLFHPPSEAIVLIRDRSAVGKIDLNQLILRIPMIGGDLKDGLVGFGAQVPIVVIGVGESIILQETIQIIVIVDGGEERRRPVAHQVAQRSKVQAFIF